MELDERDFTRFDNVPMDTGGYTARWAAARAEQLAEVDSKLGHEKVAVAVVRDGECDEHVVEAGEHALASVEAALGADLCAPSCTWGSWGGAPAARLADGTIVAAVPLLEEAAEEAGGSFPAAERLASDLIELALAQIEAAFTRTSARFAAGVDAPLDVKCACLMGFTPHDAARGMHPAIDAASGMVVYERIPETMHDADAEAAFPARCAAADPPARWVDAKGRPVVDCAASRAALAPGGGARTPGARSGDMEADKERGIAGAKSARAAHGK